MASVIKVIFVTAIGAKYCRRMCYFLSFFFFYHLVDDVGLSKDEKGCVTVKRHWRSLHHKIVSLPSFHNFVYVLVAVVVIEIGISGQGRVVMGQACLVTGIARCMSRWRRWTDK